MALSGPVIVVADAATKEQIYGKLLTVGPGKKTSIECCGEWPTDIGLMFWLKPSH